MQKTFLRKKIKNRTLKKKMKGGMNIGGAAEDVEDHNRLIDSYNIKKYNISEIINFGSLNIPLTNEERQLEEQYWREGGRNEFGGGGGLGAAEEGAGGGYVPAGQGYVPGAGQGYVPGAGGGYVPAGQGYVPGAGQGYGAGYVPEAGQGYGAGYVPGAGQGYGAGYVPAGQGYGAGYVPEAGQGQGGGGGLGEGGQRSGRLMVPEINFPTKFGTPPSTFGKQLKVPLLQTEVPLLQTEAPVILNINELEIDDGVGYYLFPQSIRYGPTNVAVNNDGLLIGYKNQSINGEGVIQYMGSTGNKTSNLQILDNNIYIKTSGGYKKTDKGIEGDYLVNIDGTDLVFNK